MSISDQTNQRFGNYILHRSLAKGGMAEIFLAEYESSSRVRKQVVLKKILPTFADDKRFVEMFIDEAKITVMLSHGNIAQVFDFGEIDGEYFLTMEYIRGHSLSQVRRHAAEKGLILPPHIVCYVVMEMCKGLHYAHRKQDEGRHLGIVHRDVSPQNVMVSYEGQVKVVDFGIAKAANVASKTRAGALKGKYLYFAPEQARARELDARTDVFAAGVMLYELITGVLPFHGQLIDVLRDIVEGRFVKPSRIVPTLKPSLERIILKAMARRPEDRYQSALELQEALAGFLYSVAPRFTSAGLAHFMRYVYADDLAEQGISTDLPSDFLEQVPLWRIEKEELKKIDPATEETDPDIPNEESNTASETAWARPPTGSSMAGQRPVDLVRRRKIKRVAIASAIVLLSVAAVAAAVVSLMSTLESPPPGAGLVVVNSNPDGARVAIDGVQDERVTPFVLESLAPGRLYVLRFSLEGHRETIETVTSSMDGPTTVSVTLEPVIETAPRPSLAEVEARIREERGIDRKETSAPQAQTAPSFLDQLDDTVQNLLQGEFGGAPSTRASQLTTTIGLRQAAIDVRRLPSLRIPLNQAKTYSLTVEGAAHLRDPDHTAPSSEACYVVARPGRRGETGVVHAGQAVEIPRGAQAVHLVVPSWFPSEGSGHLTVRVTDQSGNSLERRLDYKTNAFDPRRHGAHLIDDLSPLSSYRVSIEPSTPSSSIIYSRPGMPAIFVRPGVASAATGELSTGLVVRGAAEMAVFSLRLAHRLPQQSVEIAFTP